VVDHQNKVRQDDAKTEAEAKQKIDGVYQQLKTVGTERFGDVALAKSEDQSRLKGGDIGFASEDDLKRNNFPPALITRLFAMQPGDYTEPVQFNGRWYIFKLKRKQLEVENRTLESPGVRQQITLELTEQRKQHLPRKQRHRGSSDLKLSRFGGCDQEVFEFAPVSIWSAATCCRFC